MLENLRELNDTILIKCDDVEKKKKHELIKKLLHEKNCFLKINIETAYAILRELNIPEEKSKNIYMNLINPNN